MVLFTSHFSIFIKPTNYGTKKSWNENFYDFISSKLSIHYSAQIQEDGLIDDPSSYVQHSDSTWIQQW